MSIDNYYAAIDGQWARINTSDDWEACCTDFWVDICHGGRFAIDERYYFAELASALDFYLEGWKKRQFLNDNGEGAGLDHSGLYSRGRLIHGQSIHGDGPGHEGENLRRIAEEIARRIDEEML